jgi:hypothetical protein
MVLLYHGLVADVYLAANDQTYQIIDFEGYIPNIYINFNIIGGADAAKMTNYIYQNRVSDHLPRFRP